MAILYVQCYWLRGCIFIMNVYGRVYYVTAFTYSFIVRTHTSGNFHVEAEPPRILHTLSFSLVRTLHTHTHTHTFARGLHSSLSALQRLIFCHKCAPLYIVLKQFLVLAPTIFAYELTKVNFNYIFCVIEFNVMPYSIIICAVK